MSNANKKEHKESDGLFKFLEALGKGLFELSKICGKGAGLINWKSEYLYLGIAGWMTTSALLVKSNYLHLRMIDTVFSIFGADQLFYHFSALGWKANLGFLWFIGPVMALMLLGIKEIQLAKKYHTAFKKQGLRNSLKEEPKVKKIIKIDDNRSLVRVSSPGISPDEWRKRRDALSFDFKADIDEIKVSDDRNYIELYVSDKPLPRVVKYDKYKELIDKPYTFIVGEAKNGEVITESIRNCPHVLMGGATGMGKSTSFKLMLYSLLKNSPEDKISFTLLDLKRGVEVAEFEGFSNVNIAKNETSALKSLKKISEEMHRRYRYLESNKRTKIDPETDKVPLIVVAVDEASVIFGQKSQSSSHKENADKSRELCEEIAKLGRAAGIHMILATQRATKTSIDTTTLDNLEARICFRTRSVAGSTAILGDKSGSTLPDIPGRAIWQKGIKSVNLQVPYLPEGDLKKFCSKLRDERAKTGKDGEDVSSNSKTVNLSVLQMPSQDSPGTT